MVCLILPLFVWVRVRVELVALGVVALAWGDRGGVLMAVMPAPARTVWKVRVNCPAPSRIKKRNG
jgi:hypothetical protein